MNVILYVIDSLRADHLSCFGYDRLTTPNIDLIAEHGVVFEDCYSPSTWTSPVAASILTGEYPCYHGIQSKSDKIPASVNWLPHHFKKIGFKTSCISAIGNVSKAKGYHQGFDYFVDLYLEPSNKLKSHKKSKGIIEGLEIKGNIVLPYAEDINPYIQPWMEEHINEDIFSLLWSIDPHAPYEPPENFRKFISPQYDGRFSGKRDMVRHATSSKDIQYLIDLYDSEINYNDHAIGKLVNFLKAKDSYEESLIVIVGDHGESFGEHDLFAHGHLPYDVVMHVPMIIKFPKNEYANRRVNGLSSLVDICPTLLDYFNIPVQQQDGDFEGGKSLLPMLKSDKEHIHNTVYCQTQYSKNKPAYLASRTNEWKFIKTIQPERSLLDYWHILKRFFNERIYRSIIKNPMWLFKRYANVKEELLFDLVQDPEEDINLYSTKQELAAEMDKQLDALMANCHLKSKDHISSLSDEEEQKLHDHLKALGYIE